MLAKTYVVLATLASAVMAAPAPPAPGPPSGPCSPTTTRVSAAASPTLPVAGGTSELPAPAVGLVLKKIAIGHGIQNYTCGTADGSATAIGALAVLYDVTNLYPGTPRTGLSSADFDGLSTRILYGQNMPLNLQHKAAAAPGTPTKPNVLPEAAYGAVIDQPYPPPADSRLGAVHLPYLGVHYFDNKGQPTFDLMAKAGLLGSVKKVDGVTAPASAEDGILHTGAVQWLRLLDNEEGINVGLSEVYRVVTAGGAAQSCSDSGVGSGSVPYAAQYWFYGTA